MKLTFGPYKGKIVTNGVWIIPILLAVSKSEIHNDNGSLGGVLYVIHLTPWITFGINCKLPEKITCSNCKCD